jgi:hypothetical protein
MPNPGRAEENYARGVQRIVRLVLVRYFRNLLLLFDLCRGWGLSADCRVRVVVLLRGRSHTPPL